MRQALSVALLLAAAGAASAQDEFAEVDYAKLHRRLVKEPTYVAAPRYALFIMDLAGKVPMWVVLDKSKAGLDDYDTAYVDLNANGDLAEAGERFAGSKDQYDRLGVKIGDIKVPGTKLVHTDVALYTARQGDRQGVYVGMKWNGRDKIGGGFKSGSYDYTAFGESPASAPVLRPTPCGPLSFALWGDTELAVGESTRVCILAGSRGSGNDTLCAVDENFLAPGKDALYATLIAKDRDGKEIRLRTQIKGHC